MSRFLGQPGRLATRDRRTHRREALAEEMGGAEKVKRHHDNGKLTVRERIAALLDPGSFHEIGKISGVATYDDETGALTGFQPTNFVMGRGRIDKASGRRRWRRLHRAGWRRRLRGGHRGRGIRTYAYVFVVPRIVVGSLTPAPREGTSSSSRTSPPRFGNPAAARPAFAPDGRTSLSPTEVWILTTAQRTRTSEQRERPPPWDWCPDGIRTRLRP